MLYPGYNMDVMDRRVITTTTRESQHETKDQGTKYLYCRGSANQGRRKQLWEWNVGIVENATKEKMV